MTSSNSASLLALAVSFWASQTIFLSSAASIWSNWGYHTVTGKLHKVVVAIQTTHIYSEGDETCHSRVLPFSTIDPCCFYYQDFPPENAKEKEVCCFHIAHWLTSISLRETHDKSGSFERCYRKSSRADHMKEGVYPCVGGQTNVRVIALDFSFPFLTYLILPKDSRSIN